MAHEKVGHPGVPLGHLPAEQLQVLHKEPAGAEGAEIPQLLPIEARGVLVAQVVVAAKNDAFAAEFPGKGLIPAYIFAHPMAQLHHRPDHLPLVGGIDIGGNAAVPVGRMIGKNFFVHDVLSSRLSGSVKR